MGIGASALVLTAVAVMAQPAAWQALAADDRAPERLTLRALEVAALEQAGRLRIATERPDTLLAGRRHQFLEQYHRGLRVVGAGLRRQLEGDTVVSLFGTVLAPQEMEVTPTLSAAEASAVAVARTGGRPRSAPELVIWTSAAGSVRLAFEAVTAGGGDVHHTFVDALGGEILSSHGSRRHQAAVGGGIGVLGDRKKVSATSRSGWFFADDRLRPPSLVTYDLRGDLQRTLELLDGTADWTLADVAHDADNQWTDGAAVDAHVYVGRAYDYLFERFGRRGLDGYDHPIRSIVHPVHRYEIFTTPDASLDFFINAFWCGECGADAQGAMVFGEGLPPGVGLSNGQTIDFFAAALDIVAHELAHGVTDYSSRLEYEGESGALNEAFSDIIGVSTEFYEEPSGNGPSRPDYLLGEDVVSPGGVRSLADPHAFGDPDHYASRYRGEDDFGGVHTNSLIASHAFYLAIEGGVNRTSGKAVSGVGPANRDRVEKAFYRAFVSLLTPRATFVQAREATLAAARELYGAGSIEERAIAQAWSAVGVEGRE
jgi:Zn-dependent metalloprotease